MGTRCESFNAKRDHSSEYQADEDNDKSLLDIDQCNRRHNFRSEDYHNYHVK